MLESELFESPWGVAGLLAVGVLLVAVLTWALGRAWGPVRLADDLGALAWGAMRQVRRVFVTLAAGTLAVVGLMLLVLPGPGMLLLAAALALLATEFVWARRWILRLRERFEALGSEAREMFQPSRGESARRAAGPSSGNGDGSAPDRPPRESGPD